MKRSEKPFFIQNLTEELKSATSVVLVNYSGLNVKAQQDLKKRLQKVDAKMVVVKNTLFKLAGGEAKVPKEVLIDTVLSGPTALIIAENDPITPLQVLGKFAQEKDIPQLKVGIVEGTFQDKEALARLSRLPGKEALVAQAVTTIGGPLYGIVGVLQGNLEKLVYILKAKSKDQETKQNLERR